MSQASGAEIILNFPGLEIHRDLQNDTSLRLKVCVCEIN